MLLLTISMVWIVCGVLSFGLMYGYFQTEYHIIAEEEEQSDFIFSIMFSIAGPISLLIALTTCTKHGMLFRRVNKQ